MKRRIFYLVLLYGLYSCSTDEEIENYNCQSDLSFKTEVVLKERDPQYALDFPQRIKTRGATVNVSDGINDFLGYSYNLNTFPLGTALNIGNPIIDMDKLRAQESFYVKEIDVNVQEMQSFSYSSFDRYSFKSKDTEKITAGFSVNLGLFSLGNKNTVETIYTKNVANETKRVFGQLDVNVCGRKHFISTSSNLKNKIKVQYLNNSFVEEIHSITMPEFIETYGALVLTNYFTGGRLTAIYSGLYTSDDDTNIKEKNVDIDISATYGAPKDSAGASANFGIGSKYYREEQVTKKISGLKVSIKAIGGNLNYASFSSPQDITNINIDLSAWMSSLSPDTYRMIDINKGGLVPLSDFVLEDNLKSHIREYLMSGEFYNTEKELREPYIEIIRRKIQGLTFLVPLLVTKTGDRVGLGMEMMDATDSESTIETKIQQWKNKIEKMFGLKIITRTVVSDLDPIYPNWTFEIAPINFFDENAFSKYIDKDNNILYLLYDKKFSKSSNVASILSTLPESIRNKANALNVDKKYRSEFSEKVGFSIYGYNRALNLYALADFVNRLPEIVIAPEELLEYELIAL